MKTITTDVVIVGGGAAGCYAALNLQRSGIQSLIVCKGLVGKSGASLFAGNLVRQPAYVDVPHRRIGDLKNSDYVMNEVFWVGVYPGLGTPELDYVAAALRDFVRR